MTIYFSAEQRQSIDERYRSGATANALARELGVEPTVVRRVLTERRVPIRDDRGHHAGPRRGGPRKKRLANEADLIEQYLAGDTIAGLARISSVDRSVIRRVLKENGVEIRRRGVL